MISMINLEIVTDALKFAFNASESKWVDQKITPAITICEAALAEQSEPEPYDPIGAWNKGFEEGKRLSKPEPDKDLIQALTERDEYHEMADKLAEGIALHFDGDIGEHSSSNSPWDRALDLLDSAACAETMRLSSKPEPSEPVAEVAGDYNTKHIIFLPAGIALEVGDKLFTHPAPSKPAPLPELTDDEITALLPYSWPWGIEFARSILAAARAKMK